MTSPLDSIPASINAAFSSIFRDATLSKPGARTTDGRGGATLGAATTYACKGLVDDYTAFQRQALGIPANERKIIILAAGIASAAVPVPGDSLTIQGRTWSVVEVKSDPANATYEVRGK